MESFSNQPDNSPDSRDIEEQPDAARQAEAAPKFEQGYIYKLSVASRGKNFNLSLWSDTATGKGGTYKIEGLLPDDEFKAGFASIDAAHDALLARLQDLSHDSEVSRAGIDAWEFRLNRASDRNAASGPHALGPRGVYVLPVNLVVHRTKTAMDVERQFEVTLRGMEDGNFAYEIRDSTGRVNIPKTVSYSMAGKSSSTVEEAFAEAKRYLAGEAGNPAVVASLSLEDKEWKAKRPSAVTIEE